jgi:hypothetical protein
MPEQAKRVNLPLMLGGENIFDACDHALGRAPRTMGGPVRPARFA